MFCCPYLCIGRYTVKANPVACSRSECSTRRTFYADHSRSPRFVAVGEGGYLGLGIRASLSRGSVDMSVHGHDPQRSAGGKTVCVCVSNLNGKAWTQNRNFSLRVFGDLGFGHPSMEDHIMEELQDLVSQISDNAGGLIDVKEYVIASVANVIAALLFGRRFNRGDAKHDFLVKHLRNVLDGFESGLVVENKPNWLSTIMASLPISKPGVMRKSRILLQEFVREQIREHKNTLPQDFNRDFIDGYLKKTMEQQSKTESYFDEHHLLGNISEFLVTGTGPASMRIFWMLHICAQNPDSVQSRIQKEIDDVVGRQRQPKWEDRQAMPFTMATLKETMRWKTLRPVGGSRGIQENTFIGDYFIPKGTIVLLNSRTVHRNPDYWNNPDEFDPTRFLTGDGTELVKNEESFLAFGAAGYPLSPSNPSPVARSATQKLRIKTVYSVEYDEASS
ncbi:hypothetical protein HPB47_024622 [Ixodes persulcatus]|uniref:Uncharacterized protein n=1 Tax=Ixodes persulcatus TaxID=34615 RepID=A0AC60Q3W2_IXOPE|nr:hypothetical protein HPB47_024622 [Ixodes persulcatus]